MSQANASISVTMALKREKFTQELREMHQEIRNSLGNANMPVKIKAQLELPEDIQKKLDMKLAAIKVQPIEVPVNFVSRGMPGAGVPGMPDGDGGMPQVGGNRGMGGMGMMRNPFSPFGLARMLGGGPGMFGAVFGLMGAMNVVKANAETMRDVSAAGNNQGEIAEAMLRGRDRMGSSFSFVSQLGQFMNDPGGMRQQDVQDIVDESRLQEKTSQARYRSRTETQRMTEQAGIDSMQQGDARKEQEIALQRKEATNANRDNANTQSDAVNDLYGRRQADVDRDIQEGSAWWNVRHYMKQGYGGNDQELADLERKHGRLRSEQNSRKNAVSEEQKQREADADTEMTAKQRDLGYDIKRRQMDSQTTILGAAYSVQAIQQGMGGDNAGALGTRQLMERMQQTGEFEKQKVGLDENSSQYQEVAAKQSSAWKELLVKQAKDTDDFHRDRQNSAEENTDRIAAIEAEGAVKMRRANNELYGAMIDAAKNSTDQQVAQLDRLAKTLDHTNAPAAAQARELAKVMKQVGEETQKTFEVESERGVFLLKQQSEGQFGETMLQAAGMDRQARDAAALNKFNRETAGLDPTNPVDMEKMADASRWLAGQQALNQRRDMLSDQSQHIQTLDAQARAKGQDHVGEMAEMAQDFKQREIDAAGDSVRTRQVREYEQAKLAEVHRQLQPQSQTFTNGVDYHDALQENISRGQSSAAALKMADDIQKHLGEAGFAARNAQANGKPELDADGFNKAVDRWMKIMEQSPSLGVFKM